MVFLYYPNNLQAVNKRVQNVTISGWTSSPLWNMQVVGDELSGG